MECKRYWKSVKMNLSQGKQKMNEEKKEKITHKHDRIDENFETFQNERFWFCLIFYYALCCVLCAVWCMQRSKVSVLLTNENKSFENMSHHMNIANMPSLHTTHMINVHKYCIRMKSRTQSRQSSALKFRKTFVLRTDEIQCVCISDLRFIGACNIYALKTQSETSM